MKKSVLVRRILPLAVVFVAVYLSLPRGARFPYDYNAGRAWKYETLFAEFDCPIYKTPEQMREERSSASISVVPYYKYSEEIANKSISAAAALDFGGLRAAVTSELRSIYDKGIVADEQELDESGSSADVMYLQRDKRASKIPLTEVYRRSDALSKILATLEGAVDGVNLDSLFRATGLYDIVVPNVLYDEQTTQLVNAETIQSISPTSGYIAAGQVIVSKGEIITADIKQMLDSYKKEFESSVGAVGPSFLPYVGNVFIAAALVILLYLSILFSCPDIFDDSRYLYVLLVFLIAALPALLIAPHGETMLHAIPFTLPSLMLQAFMKPKEVAPIYIVSLLPLLLAPRVGVMLFFAFSLAGSLMMVLFKHFSQGWKQFLAALITFAILAVVCFSFVASDIVRVQQVWSLLVGLLVGSLLTVAGYPLVYLFERVFNLVSNSRLVELCNTSSPLIRTLEQKAPGTFQHSLQVMNMAEAAARAVGINPDLLRAGALYHDIGKSMNPLCFVENESLLPREDGKKYHSELTPLQSAQDIKRHVSDGIEIAQKNRLPQVIVDFIASHHGTTLVRFFYDKFLKEGGDPALVSEFRYDGHRPRTKAQIILMLCDSMEAASRTLKDHSPKAYSDFVEGIVAGKMAEGQFDEADITVRELTTVKETIKQYLAQLNHERIAYPKNKSNKK